MLSRRTLFAAGAAIGLAAAPVAVMAQQHDPWAAFMASIALHGPGFQKAAREAQAAGFSPDDCMMIHLRRDAQFLAFRRPTDMNATMFEVEEAR